MSAINTDQLINNLSKNLKMEKPTISWSKTGNLPAYGLIFKVNQKNSTLMLSHKFDTQPFLQRMGIINAMYFLRYSAKQNQKLRASQLKWDVITLILAIFLIALSSFLVLAGILLIGIIISGANIFRYHYKIINNSHHAINELLKQVSKADQVRYIKWLKNYYQKQSNSLRKRYVIKEINRILQYVESK